MIPLKLKRDGIVFLCSVCGKVKKFREWERIEKALLEEIHDAGFAIVYHCCPDCEVKNG